MVKYQGEDISFQINSDQPNLNFLDKFKMYFYTDLCFKSKFSKISEDGFNQLVAVGDPVVSGYNGIISSEDTKKMHGNLIVEIIVESSAFGIPNETVIDISFTGIIIEKSTIKQEAT